MSGKRILTNAHVVAYASQVFVQANQSTEHVPAKVTAFVPGLDMAIIEVDNPAFFEQRPPLPLADNLPAMKQTVNVYGYPVGGEQLSITQGVVSRIEYRGIAYGSAAVRIQIDAALNPGNSGGPAVSDGKLIGLVFSKYTAGDNIGYLLAAEDVKMLLAAVEKGPYTGKLQLLEEVATTENEALRAKLGLEKEAGLLIIQPFSEKPDYPLKRWDVLLKIGDQPLDSQGNVKIQDELRLSYQYLVPKLARDGHVQLTVLRDRKTIEVKAPVLRRRRSGDAAPAGQVPALLHLRPHGLHAGHAGHGRSIAASGLGATYTTYYKSPLVPRLLDQPSFAGEEIVGLTHLLPHKTSKGYSPAAFSTVSRINGTRSATGALVELLRDATGEFLVVEWPVRSNRWSFAARKCCRPPKRSSPTKASASSTPMIWKTLAGEIGNPKSESRNPKQWKLKSENLKWNSNRKSKIENDRNRRSQISEISNPEFRLRLRLFELLGFRIRHSDFPYRGGPPRALWPGLRMMNFAKMITSITEQSRSRRKKQGDGRSAWS